MWHCLDALVASIPNLPDLAVCLQDSNNPGSGTSMATQRALLAGRYKALPAHISGGARAIVAQLLVVEPEQRASLEVRIHLPAAGY